MKHSNVGASSAERWWNCPGSVQLVEGVPEQESSIYADTGTAAHYVGEKCLISGEDADEWIGEEIDTGNRFIKVTEAMAEAVQVYLDTVRNDMKKYGVDESGLKVEQKFHLDHIDQDAFGTNDANIIVPFTKLIVYDYKNGQGIAVEAIDNKQMKYYALGALIGEDIDEIELVIVQPNAPHPDGRVRRWTTSAKDLQDFANEMRKRIQATREEEAPLCAGPWCKKNFCDARPVCPALLKRATEIAQQDFSEPIPDLPEPEKMTDKQFLLVLKHGDVISDWIKACYAFAQSELERGRVVSGYKLVRGKSNRGWRNEKALTKELLDNDEAFTMPKLISPAQMEKVMDKKFVAKHAFKPEGKKTIVPVSDPRPEIESATSEFEAADL